MCREKSVEPLQRKPASNWEETHNTLEHEYKHDVQQSMSTSRHLHMEEKNG